MTLDSATADGRPASIRVDETIAAVHLPRPLQPGDSVRLKLRFAVQVPKFFDRLGHTGDSYSGAQWYPKMVVYDDEGWHPDPFHYMAEFYGDYGTFDVALRVPDDFWVGATGVLTDVSGGDNEIPLQDRDVPSDSVAVTIRAVTADTLAGKWPAKALRIETDLAADGSEPVRAVVPRGGAAFLRVPRGAPVHYSYTWDQGHTDRDEADADGGARPLRLIAAARDTSILDTLRALARVVADEDTILPSMKTLRFHAERVHDFAWVASPDYVRGDTTWSGISIRSLAFRGDQKKWADSKRFVADAMRHHSDTAGRYVWPQFTTTEAWCGGSAMEYPMLIMNEPELAGGLFQDLDDVIAHEEGHQWFYGMLGSDERTYAWLDEGFTQWLEDDYIDGKYRRGLFRWADRLPWLTPKRAFTADELSYLSRAWARDERPISTPAEQFASYRDYDAASYSKTVAMLRTLKGVIGEPAFARFLHRYYRENLFGHPRPNNVIRAAEGAAGRDLHEFFHEWVETTHRPGFAIGPTTTRRDGDVWRSTVAVRRTERMTPAVLVEARFADGTHQAKRVPGRASGRVSGEDESDVARFESRARLTGAALDPQHDLVEMNRLDNRTGIFPPMRWRPLYDFPQTDAITVLYGPTVWHGRDEGMRLGGWLEGRYLPTRDFPRGILGFEAGANVGTRTGAGAWRAGWWRRVGALGARGQVRAQAVNDEGLFRAGLTIGNQATAPGCLHPWRTWWLGAQYRDRSDFEPMDPRYWSLGRTLNGSAGILVETVGPRREDRLDLELRGGGPAFDAPQPGNGYGWARISARHQTDLFSGAARLAVRGFAGSAWRGVPNELRFDVAEASRLDNLDRFYENDRGPLRASNHYLSEGGGGLRGYAGRAVLGQRIAALNVDVTHAASGVFLFGDLGRAEASGLGESAPSLLLASPLLGRTLADAGAGYAYGPVRLPAPFWVGRPASRETPWKVRWTVSLNLAGLHPWW